MKPSNLDFLLLVMISIHLLTRQWPSGGPLQTAADILLGFSALLLAAKYLVLHMKKRP